jgi:hypothetical protein
MFIRCLELSTLLDMPLQNTAQHVSMHIRYGSKGNMTPLLCSERKNDYDSAQDSHSSK